MEPYRKLKTQYKVTRMWADAQRDGRPAEYRWRPLWKFRNSITCTTPQTLADASARVPCSDAVNLGERRSWTQSEFCSWQNPVRGKSPQNCIYSIPEQETAKRRAKFGWPPFSNVGTVMKPRRETCWNLLECPKLANRSQPLVGRSSPYCEGHLEEILLFNMFFRLLIYTLVAKFCDGVQIAIFASFLRPVFLAGRVQHTSDIHSKFALRPHHV